MRGREVLLALRKELAELNKIILDHPFILDALEGRLPRRAIELFVVNQLYIVPYDMRSLAVMLSRSRDAVEAEFFKTLMEGDYKALGFLEELARELGLDYSSTARLIVPEAVAYTHYLAWLALYATPGEAAVAMTVNLPVWGANTGKLAEALRSRYGLRSLGFLEFFAQPYEELEEKAYPIIERYLDMNRYRMVARMIQAYEKLFWDAVYREARRE